ncbi:uncharacterized protein LOC34623367 [Cyclospora cayetanensis]|uniref:Uncharacterized protein LOC34623367 n=1 Tax=Cyclospora cayetanensis TaxID=88456 RepID=A0A6P6RVW3_9EIME|nr:uncharacterized protein LOC34623367 [Cyclospora cayetanensis]
MAEREVSAHEFNFDILQQQVRTLWRTVKQLLYPPLLPLEGGVSDIPLLQGGVRQLDASVLKLQLPEAASEDTSPSVGEPFSPRRLELATEQYIDAVLKREGPRGLMSTRSAERPARALSKASKPLDRRIINRFIGEWEFDRSRSTSFSPVSEQLGVSWFIRNAVEKLNPTVQYALIEENGQLEFAITTTLTAGISKTVRLNLSGVDVEAEDEDVGAWKSVTQIDGAVLKTTQRNEQQKATLYETREIKSEGEGTQSDALWYKVVLRKEGLENEVSSVRVFKRISGPPSEPYAGGEHAAAASEGSLSTASSPAKALDGDEGPQQLPAWHAFKPRKAVSSELQWIVDHLDDPSAFKKIGCRGYETFKCEQYKFHVAAGQRITSGDAVPVLGAGRINLGKVDFQKCIDYLSKPENKMEFDSATSKVVTIATDGNFSLVYQAFKGQWGFSGREFVIACWSTKVDENRMILSCESVDWTESIEGQIQGLVRANLHLAGYDIQRQSNDDVVLTFCVQADLRTAGVPEWINSRVKAEQLTVVKSIKDRILNL